MKLEHCFEQANADKPKCAELAAEVKESEHYQTLVAKLPKTQKMYASSVLVALHNLVSKSIGSQWRRNGWQVYCFQQAIADMQANPVLAAADDVTAADLIQVDGLDKAFAQMPGFSSSCKQDAGATVSRME
jgi:hypothetical protein